MSGVEVCEGLRGSSAAAGGNSGCDYIQDTIAKLSIIANNKMLCSILLILSALEKHQSRILS